MSEAGQVFMDKIKVTSDGHPAAAGPPGLRSLYSDVKKETLSNTCYCAVSEDPGLPDYELLKKIFEGVVRAMGQMMEVRDPYTAGHQSRVSQICRGIAQRMRLSGQRTKGLELAALVHDVGKLAIPSEILSKPGRLSDYEFELIKTHCVIGYDIVKEIEFPWPVADMILQHHERLDGSGYPYGLSGRDIMLEARILSVADVIEAMSSNRPYRPAPGLALALEEISRQKDRLYDAAVVEACLAHFEANGFNL